MAVDFHLNKIGDISSSLLDTVMTSNFYDSYQQWPESMLSKAFLTNEKKINKTVKRLKANTLLDVIEKLEVNCLIY